MNGRIKMGAEPRKVAILAALLVAAAGIYFYNSRGGQETATTPKAAVPARPALKQALQSPQLAEPDAEPAGKGVAAAQPSNVAREFRPTMKHKQDEAANPEQFDPTLRTDLLDKLASVKIERVERNLFDFAPAPTQIKAPDPRMVVKEEPKMIGPEPPPPPPAPPVKPPPPPITLKFYGRALPLKDGVKRVFCLINDEVKIPAEGDVLQRRYRIKSITPTSVTVEDLQYSNQQKLAIEEPAQGSQ